MQCLRASRREDVDMAHARKREVNVWRTFDQEFEAYLEEKGSALGFAWVE